MESLSKNNNVSDYFWLLFLFTEGADKPCDDDLYESIYEVIRPPGSESDFDEIPEEEEDGKDQLYANNSVSNLSKIAEAAGRKMKKLRRNWSLKKNDITRSLSRIRKNSRPMMIDGIVREGRDGPLFSGFSLSTVFSSVVNFPICNLFCGNLRNAFITM